MPSILAVGNDASLLGSRADLLRTLKLRVLVATPDEVLDTLKTFPVDLLVICHTVTESQQIRVFLAIHECAMPARTIKMIGLGRSSVPSDEVDTDAISDASPAELLGTASQLLCR